MSRFNKLISAQCLIDKGYFKKHSTRATYIIKWDHEKKEEWILISTPTCFVSKMMAHIDIVLSQLLFFLLKQMLNLGVKRYTMHFGLSMEQ